MKKTLFVFVAIFSFAVLFTACKETKKEEVKIEVNKENIENHDHEEGEMASNVFQCPMDCEKGKTYDAAGSCPVCKMDLKEIANETAHVDGCKCVANGECKCEAGKCTCKTDMASKECTKCEPGKCTCKAEVVSNVKTTSKCEPGKCASKA